MSQAWESAIVIFAACAAFRQPPLNGPFSDSSKPTFLQGNSGCIVCVLIKKQPPLAEIHPAPSTSKLRSRIMMYPRPRLEVPTLLLGSSLLRPISLLPTFLAAGSLPFRRVLT